MFTEIYLYSKKNLFIWARLNIKLESTRKDAGMYSQTALKQKETSPNTENLRESRVSIHVWWPVKVDFDPPNCHPVKYS